MQHTFTALYESYSVDHFHVFVIQSISISAARSGGALFVLRTTTPSTDPCHQAMTRHYIQQQSVRLLWEYFLCKWFGAAGFIRLSTCIYIIEIASRL